MGDGRAVDGLVGPVVDRAVGRVRLLANAGAVGWLAEEVGTDTAGVGAGILIVCVSGFFAARGAVNAAPVDVLRGAPA